MPRDGFSELTFKRVSSEKSREEKAAEERFDEVTGQGRTLNDTLPEPPTESMPPLTGDAAKLAKITATLKALIDRETDLLHQRKPNEARKLHGEKSRLMVQYKDSISRLRLNSAALGGEESTERRYIKKLTDGMRDSLKAHARVVLRMKAITEGLIQSVGDEVSRQKTPFVGYGQSANFVMPTTAQPTSLALNQVI